MSQIKYVEIGKTCVRPSIVGVGSQCVSALKDPKTLQDYSDKDGYKIPNVVTIVKIINEETVLVKDCFSKEYEKSIDYLEPVLFDFNGFECYTAMQKKVKSIFSE